MNDTDHAARTARALSAHGLSLSEYFVMISAGYRANCAPDAFVEYALAVSAGDRRGEATLPELAGALERLRTRGLLTRLTEADLHAEARRRVTSDIPEVGDAGYDVGDVDFTAPGYAVYREVI